MGCILDTSFLVALHNPKDVNHERAQELTAELLQRTYGEIYLTDYLFDEFLTVLLTRTGNHRYVVERGTALLEDPLMRILLIEPTVFRAAWAFFQKYHTLSFTDCSTAAMAAALKIDYLLSFDAQFDRISGIRRIC